MRVLFVVGSVVPIVPGFLVYLVLWLVVPLEDATAERNSNARPRR